MSTATEQSDHEEVIRAAIERRPIDPEASKRVRARAELIREQLRQKFGTLDVAVELIREFRDQ